VLLATRTHMSSFRDETGTLTVHESIQREEVTEFSEAPLEPGLFVPPLDFKHVPQLPGGPKQAFAYRTRLRWELLKDSLRLENRIARFISAEQH
jgi:hypothetical protein